jgi:hypothetical protein
LFSRLRQLLRRLAEPPLGPGSHLTPEADLWLGAATAEFNQKQANLFTHWRFGETGSYHFDQETGHFVVTMKDGTRAEGTGSIVGSHDAASRTWEWAWNHPRVALSLLGASKKAQAIGAQFDLRYCLQGITPCADKMHAAYLSSIALKAADGLGIFFAHAGTVTIHILLHDLRWAESAA